MSSNQKIFVNKIIFLVMLINFSLNIECIANQGQKDYSLILRKSIHTGTTKGGRSIIDIDDSAKREFNEPNGIEFLIDVMINGPDWPNWKEEKRISPNTARIGAARILGQIRDKRAVEPLVEMLKNGDFLDIKKNAAGALGDFGDQRAVGPLINAVETSDNNSVKIESIRSLGRLKSLDAVQPLIKILQNKEEDKQIKQHCIDSLILIRDMRTLTLVLSAVEEIDYYTANLSGMTRVDLGIQDTREYVRDEKTGKIQPIWTSKTYTDLGKTASVPKIWQHWFEDGKKWTQQEFERNYTNWKETKQKRPNEKDAILGRRSDIAKAGVGALPLIIEKIKQGEAELIPVVSELSGYDIKEDASSADVLKWWDANKERWTIFDYSASQGN